MIVEVTRDSVARWLRWLSLAAFSVMVATSPLRGRITLVGRRTVPIYGDFTDVLLFAADAALLVTLATWAASLVLARRRPLLGPRFLTLAVAVLLAIAMIGIPFAVDPALTSHTVVRFLLLAALACYVRNEITSLYRMVIPVAAMLISQGIVAIGQVVAQESLGLDAFGERELDPATGVSVVTTRDGTRILRAYGLSDHPNLLGGVVAFGLLVVIGAALSARGRTSTLGGVSLAIGSATLLVTFSRGAWLGFVTGLIALAVIVGFGPERRGLRLLAAAVALVGLSMAPFFLPYRDVFRARTDTSGTISTEARSVNERATLAEATTEIVADNVLLGVGIGNLPLAIRDAEPDFIYDYQPAATVLLDVTAETGVIGGIAYLVILVGPWVALARNRLRWTAEVAGASALLMAITVVGLFDYYPWTYLPGRIWSWLALGLWASVYERARMRSTDAD